jgi:hypothetical protein
MLVLLLADVQARFELGFLVQGYPQGMNRALLERKRRDRVKDHIEYRIAFRMERA